MDKHYAPDTDTIEVKQVRFSTRFYFSRSGCLYQCHCYMFISCNRSETRHFRPYLSLATHFVILLKICAARVSRDILAEYVISRYSFFFASKSNSFAYLCARSAFPLLKLG